MTRTTEEMFAEQEELYGKYAESVQVSQDILLEMAALAKEIDDALDQEITRSREVVQKMRKEVL